MSDSKTLPVRCKEFFGLKPNQTSSEFLRELKELTDQDKNELCEMFNAAGMPTHRVVEEKK